MNKIYLSMLLLVTGVVLSACTTDYNVAKENNRAISEKVGTSVSGLLQVDSDGNTKFDNSALQGILDNSGVTSLNADEIAGIKFMLEEEKLARDVYTKLYEKWQQPVFNNISQSEATHVSAVRGLADKYAIDTSFYSDETGQFTNEKLAKLYNDLVAQGEGSITEALKIGALIEEIDIMDLEELQKNTDNEDIKLVYSNLVRGSRNHLRSFVGNLNRKGEIYLPQRLNQADYNEILSSQIERGGTGRGSGAGSGVGGNGKNGNSN